MFIGGGGELATARELLKHKSVERIVMVDIDKLVSTCAIASAALLHLWSIVTPCYSLVCVRELVY